MAKPIKGSLWAIVVRAECTLDVPMDNRKHALTTDEQ
jgi:hypothetical protein